MEDLLAMLMAALAEMVGEVLLEVFAGFGVSLSLRAIRRIWAENRDFGVVISTLLIALGGVVLGLISILIIPHPLVRRAHFHGVSLLLAPLLTGLVMAQAGQFVRRRGQRPTRIEHFGYGFAFALGMAVVRLLGTS